MAETTLDSLQIEIEASSSQATKRIDELTAALKRLQSATSGKFGNVGGRIGDIGTTEQRTRQTTSPKTEAAPTPTTATFEYVEETSAVDDNTRAKNENTAATGKNGDEHSKAARDVRKLKNEYKQATGPISKFTRAFGRIAYYRAIRSAIKAVTDGIKTGMDNLYEYSRITGTEFKPAMDSLATSSLYLKNSLGALIGPIVQSLAPAVEYLTDRFVDLINVFNQFISALSGKDVYTAAKKHAVEYKEATDAAAKSTKKFLLGIDELNIMDSPAGKAGSAATDYGDMFEEKPIENNIKAVADALKPLLKYVDLIAAGLAAWTIGKPFFESLAEANTGLKLIASAAVIALEFKVSKWSMKNFLNSNEIGNEIKNIGINVLTQAVSGYAMFKMWGAKGIIISAAVGLVANLSAIHYEVMAGNINASDPKYWIANAVSAALATVGGGIALSKMGFFAGEAFGISAAVSVALTLATINFSQIASGNWKAGGIESVLTSLGTIAASALGGYVLAGAVFGAAAGPVGIAVGIGVGAVLSLVAIEMGSKVAYESSDFHKEMQAIVDKAQERIDVSKTIMVNIDTRYTEYSKIEGEYDAYLSLIDRIFELDALPEKNAEQLTLLSGLVDTLNSANLDGLNLTFNEATGKINETKDSVYGVIEGLKEQAKMEATYDLLVQAYKDSALAAKDLKGAQDELSTTSSKVDELQRKYNETLEKNKKLMGESTGAYAEHYGIAKDTGAAYAANKQEIEYMNSELAELKRQLDDAKNAENKAKQAVDELGAASNKTKEQIGFFENELGNLNKKTEQVAPQIESAFNDIPKEWGNSAKDGMTEIKKTITNKDRINEFKTSANTIGTNISQGTYEGIKKDQPSFLKKIGGWASGILDKVKGIFGIHSPSTVFRDEVGYNLGAGVALGLESATSEIVSAAESIADSTMKVFDEISYDPNINYKALMDEAEASGNWREYIELEKTRNAKISGEGLKDYTKTYNYAYISDEFLNSFDTPYKNYERDYDYSSYSGIDYDKINSILVKNSEEIVARMSQENQARTTTMMATISDDVEESSNNIVNAVMAIGQQIVQAVNSKETNFTLDGKQLARAMQGYNEQATRNRGGSLVRVGG